MQSVCFFFFWVIGRSEIWLHWGSDKKHESVRSEIQARESTTVVDLMQFSPLVCVYGSAKGLASCRTEFSLPSSEMSCFHLNVQERLLEILIWMHPHWRIVNMLHKKKHNLFFSLTASGAKNTFKKFFDCIVFYLFKELNLCKYNQINC